MSDRQPAPHSGQFRPRMSGGSSVQMEDRNVLRRMERERRSQEVQPEETQYDGSAPLFNKPYKKIKDDELSSLIQRMLGNYEEGCDGAEDPALPQERSSPPGDTDGPGAVSGPAPGESWVSFSALSPPVEPLSPLRSSDSDSDPSPERRRPDAPPLNLQRKLPHAKKPTAYVKPWDGPLQTTSGSPDPKTSLDTYEDLQDLKESGKPNLAPLQAADMVSRVTLEDILQEMTSWPPLLTTISSPTPAEPPKLLSASEETHGLPAFEAHKSPDKAVPHSQRGSSSSSDSDSSSDTDSEKNSIPDKPAAPETIHTQPQNEWQLGRWLERKGNQRQQNPKSPCDVIRPNSHDSSERTEAPGSCHSVLAEDSKASDRRQTVRSTCEENASTHTPSQPRKRPALHTQPKRTTEDLPPPLLVKIGLNLLSRVPREPRDARPRAENSRASRHKREMEIDEKSSKKKQKLDKESKHSSSSQQSLHQSEALGNNHKMMKKKKSVEHSSGVPQDRGSAPGGQQKKAETHGKKTSKSQKELLEKAPAAETRALLPDRRKLSVEDHLKEAKRLKHKADATPDRTAKALRYLEAALSFAESAEAMQAEPQTPKSAYTMFSETVDLIRFILKLKNYTDASGARDRDFCVLCMRCQALLQMAMFRSRREPALRHSRALADHLRSSCASPSGSRSGALVLPQHVQQMAAAYVSVTALLLNAHDVWEQADLIALRGSGLLRELDSAVGPLSLMSSVSALVRYARHGLHWIRLDSQKPR